MTAPRLSEANETIKRALALAARSPPEALNLLEEALETARRGAQRESIHVLARNAGVVCTGLGDFRRAIRYYEEALSSVPGDASLHLARGDLLRRLGEYDEAAGAFVRALEHAARQGDSEMMDIASKAKAGLDNDAGDPEQ